MSANWSAIEDALQAWFVAGSGLSAVIWADQDGVQPGRPYASLKLFGPIPIGGALDELRNVTNLTNPAGQEIEQTVVGQREIAVSCQVYADATTGAGGAREYASKAQTALRLPARQAAFQAAGLALIDAGQIQSVPEVVATKWQARAVFDVRFSLVDSAVEKTGYIATVVPAFHVT